MMLFEGKGYCYVNNPWSHSAMPITATDHNTVMDIMRNNKMTSVPIGGYSREAACYSTECTWLYNQGMLAKNPTPFYHGAIVDNVDKTASVPGFYNNFTRNKTPDAGDGTYWGKRQPFITSDGAWSNRETNLTFTDWVCGVYELGPEDTNIPTFPDGTHITPDPQNSNVYKQCNITIVPYADGVWPAYRCKDPLQWWIPLVIACVVYVVVVAIIIAIGCCLCCSRHRKEMNTYKEDMRSAPANPVDLPAQSQIGMGRTASMYGA